MKAGNKSDRMDNNIIGTDSDCFCFSGYDYITDDACCCNETFCKTTSQYAQKTKTKKEQSKRRKED